MLFDALVAGYIRRQGLRALVTVVAVALGVSVYLAVRLVNAHAVAALAAQTGVFGDDADFVVTPGSGTSLGEALLTRIETAPGISEAVPVIDGRVVVPPAEVLRVEGRDLLAPLPRAIEFRTRLAGPFSPNGSEPGAELMLAGNGIIVSSAFAGRHDVRPGARLDVRAGTHAARLVLAAVFPRDVASIDGEVAIVDVATARRLFGRDGFDRIACTAMPGRVEDARRAVAALVPPGARIASASERRREVERLLAGLSANLGAIALLALAVASLVLYDAIAISVLRRAPEIGTLRALGTPRRAVARTFLFEGALLGSIGSLVGVGGGTVLATWAGAIPAAGDPYSLDRIAPLVAFAVGVALAQLAALGPARAAASLPPVLAIARTPLARADAHSRVSRRSRRAGVALALGGCASLALMLLVRRFEWLGVAAGGAFVAAATCTMPSLVAAAATSVRERLRRATPAIRLALANLAASPPRVAASLSALTVSVALATAVVVFACSFRASVDRFAAETLGGDLVVVPFGGANVAAAAFFPSAAVARVAALPGVARIDALRSELVPYAGTLVQVRTHSRRVADASGAVVDSEFAALANVRAGDVFDLRDAGEPRRLRVRDVVDGDPLGPGTLDIDAGPRARESTSARPNVLELRLRAGSDVARVRARIEAIFGGMPIDVRATRELRAELLRRVDAIARETFALAALAVAIGSLGIATALGALVLERREETRLVRVAGMTRGDVGAMVLYEAAALGALGGAFGTVLGLSLALVLLATDRAVFGWLLDLVVPPSLPFAMVAGSVVVAAVAGFGPARLASRLSMSRAARTLGSLLLIAVLATPPAHARASARGERVVWRVLGHLRAADGARFDVAATFFRFSDGAARPVTLYASSLSVVDESLRVKTTALRVDRDHTGRAASGPGAFDVDVDDWQLRREGRAGRASRDGFRVRARSDVAALDVRLVALLPPAELGSKGRMRSGSCVACYVRDVAYPRLAARGTLRWNATTFAVTGIFWIDRESGGPQLAPGDRGWDRFTFVLDDGRALLVRRVRGGARGNDTSALDGAFIARSGRVSYLGAKDLLVENAYHTTWRDAAGVAYPSLWEVFVPKLGFDFAVVPDIQAQEIDAGIRGAHFYDGSVDVERAPPGPRDSGRGFVELTGYDEPLRF